jgi:hypothetical protein
MLTADVSDALRTARHVVAEADGVVIGDDDHLLAPALREGDIPEAAACEGLHA